MKFKLIKKLDSGVRVGEVETAHGIVNTPFFMPVATVGSVKSVSPDELRGLGADIVLSNTYHLYLRPGEKNIKKLGGLHKFMNWDGPILTDSGGYQVFSLAKNKSEIRNPKSEANPNYQIIKSENLKAKNHKLATKKSLVKIFDDGVEFTSHIDGSKHFFTPEKVIQIQLDLGVDILMPLDYCPSGKASAEEVTRAVDITIAWAKRSKVYFDKTLQTKSYKLNPTMRPALFGIVQGGLDPELRKYCAEELIKLNFDGYSVGGLAVDHETRDMWKTVKQMGEILPEDKPRYLMGVGTPDDIIKATALGMDMFDCVLPTRLARHGSVFVDKNGNSKSLPCRQAGEILNPKQIQNQKTKFELINLLNSKYRTDGEAIDKDCKCPACAGGFTKAYISHLIRENEVLGLRLATLHNLLQYLDLTRNLQKSS